MKKTHILSFLAFMASLFLQINAMAQIKDPLQTESTYTQALTPYSDHWRRNNKTEIRRATVPEEFAIIFTKVAGQEIDFKTWIKKTPAYKETYPDDQPAFLAKEEHRLKSASLLITGREQVSVEYPIEFSDYDTKNKGFFIKNFKEDTSFPVFYGEQSYAIIPEQIKDHLFLKVEDLDAVEKIKTLLSKSPNKTIPVTITLTPKFADATSPAMFGEDSYFLMSAKIFSFKIYTDDNKLLWRSGVPGENNEQRQKLLDLWQ